MALMPGKTLSNTVFIAAFYVTVLTVRRLQPGQMLLESRGPGVYVLSMVLFLGLVDRRDACGALPDDPGLFWRYIFPVPPTQRKLAVFARTLLVFAAVVAAFLFVVLVVAPPITERHFGYRFDYLSEMFHLGGYTRTGTSMLHGPKGSLTPALVLENVTTLFGLSLAPRFISPLLVSPWGDYPGSQVTNVPKLVIFAVFFGATAYVAWRATGPFGTYFRGLLVAIGLFLLYLCLLSIRHIPVVTGYYYGAAFASLFAILVGMMLSGVGRVLPRARSFAALAVVGIVTTQMVNFWPINDGWRYAHDDVMLPMRYGEQRSGFQKRYPLVPGRPLTVTEINGIWSAWRRNRMDRYTRDNGVSPGAAYLIFELREAGPAAEPVGPG